MPFSEWKLRNSSSTTAAGGSLADRRFEHQQAAPDRSEMLLRLGEIVFHEGGEEIVAGSIRHPRPQAFRSGSDASEGLESASNSVTEDASVAGENGFVMYAEAPACSAASRLVSSPRVVRTMTGTSL